LTGIEKISARIEQDAHKTGQEALQMARQKAQEIIAEYQKEADVMRAGIAERGAASASDNRLRMLGAAELESRKRILSVKQELIGQVYKKAAVALQGLGGDELCSLLSRLCAEACQTGDEKIVLSQSDFDSIGKRVCDEANSLLKKEGRNASLTLAEPREIPGGGVMLSSGDIEANCTFLSLVETQKSYSVVDVAKILFEEG